MNDRQADWGVRLDSTGTGKLGSTGMIQSINHIHHHHTASNLQPSPKSTRCAARHASSIQRPPSIYRICLPSLPRLHRSSLPTNE